MQVYHVWLVHMLQPAAYQRDCAEAFGRCVPHENRPPAWGVAAMQHLDELAAAVTGGRGFPAEEGAPGPGGGLPACEHVRGWMGVRRAERPSRTSLFGEAVGAASPPLAPSLDPPPLLASLPAAFTEVLMSQKCFRFHFF